MHRHGSRIHLSASDLVAFHDCAHLTQLDRRALDDPDLRKQRCEDDEQAKLIQRKGHEFEARYLAHLEATHRGVVRIDHARYDPERQAADTLAAMRAGAPVIYQATLLREDLVGHADFLRRVERPSSLGDWSYEVIDTKLARSEKPKFVLQLCFYSELLAVAGGATQSLASAACRSRSPGPRSPPPVRDAHSPVWLGGKRFGHLSGSWRQHLAAG